MKKVAGMNDYFRAERQNPADDPLECVVYVLLTGVDAFVADAVVGLVAEMGVGEVDDYFFSGEFDVGGGDKGFSQPDASG